MGGARERNRLGIRAWDAKPMTSVLSTARTDSEPLNNKNKAIGLFFTDHGNDILFGQKLPIIYALVGMPTSPAKLHQLHKLRRF